MSMNGEFREITPRLLARLMAEPSLTEAVVLADLLAARGGSGLDFLLGALPAAERKAMESYLAQASPEERERMEAAGQQAMEGLPGLPAPGGGAAAVPPDELGEKIGIGKAWHGLHYLLCGSAEPAEGDLAAAVLGGVEIGGDGGYGPARYLEPISVHTIAAELARVSENELRGRYDAEAMEAASVYPGHWADEENLAWLLHAWREVAAFYAGAAARGNAALLYLV